MTKRALDKSRLAISSPPSNPHSLIDALKMWSILVEAFSTGNNRVHPPTATGARQREDRGKEEKENLGLSRAHCQLQPPRERHVDQHGLLLFVNSFCHVMSAIHAQSQPLLHPGLIWPWEVSEGCCLGVVCTHPVITVCSRLLCKDIAHVPTTTYRGMTASGLDVSCVLPLMNEKASHHRKTSVPKLPRAPGRIKLGVPPSIRFSRFSGNPYDL